MFPAGRASYLPSLKSPVRQSLASRRFSGGLPCTRTRLPGLMIFEIFKNLIRTLPAQCYDETHKEDIDTNAEDHCFDALRYRLTRGTGKLVRMT